MTIIEKLDDLHKQAVVERSHYYVGSVVDEAKFEIKRLSRLVEDAYNEGLFSGKPWAGSEARHTLANLTEN